MADDINPTSGSPIDLRNMPTGGATNAASGGTTSSGGQPGNQSVFDKFEIPETVKQQYPDLIPLILGTESMNDDERQYWFQILPIMTDEQVGKLREILTNEKSQLAQLDKNYEAELKQINKKHVSEWKAFEAKEKREKREKTEAHVEKTEKEEEEDLMKKLQGL
jgi:hypothetical protein